VSGVNAVLTRLFDLVLAPVDRLPPMAGLAVLSLVTAVAVLYAFRWTADQAALVRSKRGMQAAVFEMRLFNDDLVALFRAQGQVVQHTLGYLRSSFAPTLWLIVPMALLMIHMEFHFGYTGLAVGEAALLKVRFSEGSAVPSAPGAAPGDLGVTLEAPPGVRVETPAVLLPSAREIAWRISPTEEGAYQLSMHFPAGTVLKTLLVSGKVGRRSPLRPGDAFVDQMLYPSEPPMTGDGVQGLAAIELAYPEREVMIAGWDVGWVGVYLGLTLVFAFALKGPLGVEM
jgi:uncharacterized membrane protein (DUF106 family)